MRVTGCENEHGDVLRTCRHLCWDGCMFPNDVMLKPETWNEILAAMIEVQEAHGVVGVIRRGGLQTQPSD